jgi:small conductance mechanosensitive channel
LVKRTYEAHGISMPDEAREVLFPDGVSVRVLEVERSEGLERPLAQPVLDAETISSGTEGNLVSEDEQLQAQARLSRIPEEGKNLLEKNPQEP